jgi:superoxide reductase
MTQIKYIYKCEICGNIVEVLHQGPGQLVCCGQPMKLMEAMESDPEKGEKHLPIIEESDDGFLVKVGEIIHPMTEEHHIEWIELVSEKGIYRKHLKANDKPEALFEKPREKIISVREYCNLHGLWETKI